MNACAPVFTPSPAPENNRPKPPPKVTPRPNITDMAWRSLAEDMKAQNPQTPFGNPSVVQAFENQPNIILPASQRASHDLSSELDARTPLATIEEDLLNRKAAEEYFTIGDVRGVMEMSGAFKRGSTTTTTTAAAPTKKGKDSPMAGSSDVGGEGGVEGGKTKVKDFFSRKAS